MLNLKTILKQTTQFIFPTTCIACKQQSFSDIDLCIDCEKKLPFLHYACFRCAEPLPPSTVKQAVCGECLKNPPPFDETNALFRYDDPIDKWIMQIKFHENLIYARTLGLLMTKYFADTSNYSFDAIIPMPLHRSRLKQRGFNQALEIARPLSRHLNIPLQFHHCHRIRQTDAQSQLKFDERISNVKHAFSIDKQFSAKKVLVIDDVITTGNTMREFCTALKHNGVEYIAVWVCARTVLK